VGSALLWLWLWLCGLRVAEEALFASLGWGDHSRIEAQCEGTRDDDTTAC
jgi:hypothetical protein